MKKTIAAIAMIVSSNAALAMPVPRDPNAPAPKISSVCLSTYTEHDGSKDAGCDESYNNKSENKKVLVNGCATGQIALQFIGESPIEACMPPGVAQL